MPATAEAIPETAQLLCYHCGEVVPANSHYSAQLAGTARPMCCPGCVAVAELIASSGLDNFYQQRTAYNERPTQSPLEPAQHYTIYDDPDLAATFSEQDDRGVISARLLLGGINCAACTWLIERSLGQLDGVNSAVVNLQQARLDINLDPGECPLSKIFAQLESLGYRPQPFRHDTRAEQFKHDQRRDLKRLAVAGLGMMQVGMFAIALHAGDIQGMDAQYQSLLRWVSLPVAGFVAAYAARGFFTSAWRHLKQGALVMDTPVALAIALAFVASVWATVTGSGQVYFDSVVMFTFFLLLARYLEQQTRQRHLQSWFDAESNLPSALQVRRDGDWQLIPRIQITAGDSILIKPGETIGIDARVTEGRSAVQEATFNGEHLPRTVDSGDIVYAGTVNTEGPLQVAALGDYRDSRLAALQRSVELAQTEKPQLTKIADRIAGRFIATVLVIAALTAIAWLQLDPEKALWITLSVLVISCPCALAIATPAALTSASNGLRNSGVIVHGENALETLASCTHLVLDKTGTLTAGVFTIVRVVPLHNLDESDILALAGALQRYSSHPIASAFASTAQSPALQQVNYVVGAGVEGYYQDDQYRMGSEKFCKALAHSFPSAPDQQLYWIGLCRNQTPLAWVGLNDRVRPEAAAVVKIATAAGMQVELLTGDSSAQGVALARSLGIEKIMSGLTPGQKTARVQALQAAGARVAMVGDGLNDAPVLSVADTSFAVAGATDLARTQADFVIADGNLHKITDTLGKARKTRRIIVQNFCWAIGYNICAIPLAACGFVPPWAAALGMSASSLLVVFNSLRLNRRKGH